MYLQLIVIFNYLRIDVFVSFLYFKLFSAVFFFLEKDDKKTTDTIPFMSVSLPW